MTELYEPLSDECLWDPTERYAKLRSETPIFWHEQMKSWVLTRYDDCRRVLTDNDTFARDRRRVGRGVPEVEQNVQSLDPPRQSDVRRIFVSEFKDSDIEGSARAAGRLVDSILASMPCGHRFDFMRDVAAPAALTLTCELMGVSEPDLDRYMSISDAIARNMDGGLLPSTIPPGRAARAELAEMITEWERDAEPTSLLRRTLDRAGSVEVAEHYVRNTFSVMFNASFGTAYAIFGNVGLRFVQDKGELMKIGTEFPIGPAVEELIRLEGPSQGTSRSAVVDTTIRGQHVAAGDTVLALVAAANRDPEVFIDPDRLDLSRSPNRHLAFGWGPHACLGIQFGKASISELVFALQSHSSLRLEGKPVRRSTATVRCMDSLLVAV